MSRRTVFTTNRSQAVRLPTDVRLPDTVKRVNMRAVGVERIIAPANAVWDSFFLGDTLSASDGFMAERASQHQSNRESF